MGELLSKTYKVAKYGLYRRRPCSLYTTRGQRLASYTRTLPFRVAYFEGIVVLSLYLSIVTPSSQDDAEALDLATMRRWNMMLRVFMAEYLHLRPESPQETLRRSDCELVSRIA